jgi:hypothetical protein
MIDLYLFEIKCAEEIGDYRLADSLDNKLVRMASSDHKAIQKAILKKISNNEAIKDVYFSNSRQKFIVSADQSVNNSDKREIQKLAGPFSVSFRYSNKTIDELMAGESEDPTQRHLDSLEQMGPDYIGLDALDDMEPTDEELRFTAEHPADDLGGDLDEFLLEFARDNARKLPGY